MRRLIVTLIALAAADAGAQSSEPAPAPMDAPLEAQRSSKQSAVVLGAEYFRITHDGTVIANWGVAAGLQLVLGERWLGRLQMRQLYSYKDKLAALYTGITVEASYMVIGSPLARSTRWSQGGRRLVEIEERPKDGLLLGATINQYFFNVGTESLPFAGFGVTGAYMVPVWESAMIGAGLGTEYLRGGDRTLRPIHAMFPLILQF